MTSVINTAIAQALRKAAVRATLAPSVHNTQPWRFVIRGNELDIYADWTRKLHILDPSGRQLLISCGCALFNARVALAAAGYLTHVDRFPDPNDRDLVARIVAERPSDDVPLAEYDAVIELRQTNRRRFADEPVPADVVDALLVAARDEEAELFPITRLEDRLTTASLSQQADREQNADPAYRAELRAWTTDDSARRDGVPALAVPHVDGSANDDLPIRDFDTRGDGWLPIETRSSVEQCLLLLGTAADDPTAWLRSGEALEHVLLEVTRRGYAASPLTQVVEIPRTRSELRSQLQLYLVPHVLLRVGRAPKTPASRRRRLVDVLSEDV